MSKGFLSLNGDWTMQYLGADLYESEAQPQINEGYLIEDAVPGYWEDMLDKFRSNPTHTILKYNPSYTLQRYPQAGYVPDMALNNVLGTFAYTRKFEVCKDALKGEIEIFFGGVQNTVSTWINGNFIGKHEGYSSSFGFKIDCDVLNDGENEVVLVVSNLLQKGYKGRPVSGCTNRAANECTGGIYGNVEIRSYADGLKNAHVSTAKDLASFTVSTIGAIDVEREVIVMDGDKVVKQAQIKTDEESVEFLTTDMVFWSTDCPKRYTLIIKTLNQTFEKEFGLRRLTVAEDGIHLKLNGKPFFFRGICEHGYYWKTVQPVKDKKYYRAVIRTLKNLGFNSIRFHTWVPMPEYCEAADELGMLIEVETPNNTTYREWCDIVAYTRQYTSVIMYSSGNEMVIDEDYIEHLRACAGLVHENTDSLFSPMSAMRGIEYFSYGDNKVEEPFPHNPVRLKALGEFCDVYNSYSLGRTSYWSEKGTYEMLDERNAVYKKPLLSHEICINGTYCDLSLKDRYKGTRIGETELFTSVERHLEQKGLLDRAPKYYKNSCEWQRRLRKHCFETVRRTDTFAGYDFLGDIDHHWHTFGYCVGMMNEFYELKPSETVQNVRRYSGDTVLLADLPQCLNFKCGQKITLPLLVSHYAEQENNLIFNVRLTANGRVFLRKSIKINELKSGAISKICDLSFAMPKSEKPLSVKLNASLNGGNTDVENEWELYAFPNVNIAIPSAKVQKANNLVIASEMDFDAMIKNLKVGKKVVIFGNGPFAKINTAFQMALAGRTEGHLATVINDHPLMEKFPHDGFCGWQFRNMLNEGYSAPLDNVDIDYEPIIEIASSYKYARRESVMFEYKVGEGKLFVCTLNLPETDMGARYLKSIILSYVMSDEFDPAIKVTAADLYKICHGKPICVIENTNEAFNANDVTM